MKSPDNVMKNRNFVLVFLGALVSELGAILYNFAVSFYILQVSGNSAFLQGLYLALCGITMLLFTPVGGVLGDRRNKARIMYVCDYLKGGLILAAAGLMLLFRDSQSHLIILFCMGIAENAIGGIFSPAAEALIPHIVPEDRLQQANSYMTMKSSFESIFGIVLAGVLYAAMPVTVLFAAVGICYVLSGVSEMLIRYRHEASAGRLTLKIVFADMKDGLRYVRSRKAILFLLGSILFINFFYAPVISNFIPFFVRTDIAGAPSFLFDSLLTPELWSSVFSLCIGVGTLIGAAVLSSRKPAEKCGHSIAVTLCIDSGVMILLTLGYWFLVDQRKMLNPFLILFGIGCLAEGLLVSLINIPAASTLMRIVDRDKLSKVNSITNVGSQGLIPIASVLAGAVLQSCGSTLLLTVCTLGFTATALLMLFSKPLREI